MCHLAWHYDLRNEIFDKMDYLCESFKLLEVNNKYLAASFGNIADINKCSIPYGIRMPIEGFGDENRYIGTVDGEGLTCATFILSVLEKNGFNIIDKNSWEIREEDREWQENIIEGLKPKISDVYLANANEMIGQVVRFRPDEVFASGVIDDVNKWPIEFQDAIRMASEIGRLLG